MKVQPSEWSNVLTSDQEEELKKKTKGFREIDIDMFRKAPTEKKYLTDPLLGSPKLIITAKDIQRYFKKYH